MLGPSGEARFSVTVKAPGAVVITSGVLNSVDVPVRVMASRRDGGAVWLGEAASTDARAVLASSAVSTVSGVRYPAGTLDLRASGAGALTNISTADIWRHVARGVGSAALVVDPGSGPETAVVTSGDGSDLSDVTMTLTWADRTWFLEALAVTMIGAVIAVFALGDRWAGRALGGRTDAHRTVARQVPR
jgi:hypothetical protein